MGFTGFPDEAFEFFEGLEADNTKTYWTAHRPIFESAVRGPLEELFTELEPEFGEWKVFRPYRDVRFSKDKSPYKTHLGGHSGGLYVGLDATGVTVGGGFHADAPDQLARYRSAVDSAGSGGELASIVAGLTAAGFSIGGDQLKTRPRGFAPDHPRVDLLRHRSLRAGTHWEPESWVQTPEVVSRVVDVWRDLRPLVSWGVEYVGPSTQGS